MYPIEKSICKNKDIEKIEIDHEKLEVCLKLMQLNTYFVPEESTK
jgi:hypothetical protein